MSARRLFISAGLAATMIAVALICPLLWAADNTDKQTAQRTVPYQRIRVGDYQNSVSWNDEKHAVLCALIQTSAQYGLLFHSTAVMHSNRPFAPDAELYKSEQILVVARVMAAPANGQLDEVFEVEKLVTGDGGLAFYYRFNKPEASETYFVRNCLALRIPRHDYNKVTFFENGEKVGELRPSEGQWSVPSMAAKQDVITGDTDPGAKNRETAKDLLSRAVAMAQEITDLKEKERALDQIAIMCEEIGQGGAASQYRLSALEAKAQFIQNETFAFYDEKVLAIAYVAVKFAAARQSERAVTLLTDAYEMTKNIKDDARRVYTFAQLADRYTQAGEKDEAVKILSQMLIEVNSLKYDYAKDPDIMRWGPQVMMPTLPFLRRQKIEETVKDSIRSEIAINFAGAGQYERGLEIAKGIKDIFVITGTSEEIAYRYISNGQYEQALHVIEGIGNQMHKGDALSDIAYKFADAGQYDYAVRSAKMITYKPLGYLVLVNISKKEIAAGHGDEAAKTLSEVLQILKDMKGAGIDSADVLLNAADINLRLGQKEEVIKILSQAFQIVKGTGEDFEKGSRFEEIAKKSLWAGDFDMAFQAVGALKEKHLASTILAEIGAAYAHTGQTAKAEEVLSQALQMAQAIENKGWREIAYKEIAVRYSEIGQYEKAIEIPNLINDNLDYKNEALENIAIRMAQDGHPEKGIELAKDIKGYQRTDALNAIARYLAQTGDYDTAFEAFKGMEDSYLISEVSDILIGKYAEAGQYDRVMEVSKNTQYGRDSTAYSQIAINCAQTGQLERALENLEHVPTQYIKALTLAKMGVIYAKGEAGQAKGASSVTQKIRTSGGVPLLEVTGISGGAKPVAIVNGEMVEEGSQINGVKVIKINKDTVTFEYDGKVIVKELSGGK